MEENPGAQTVESVSKSFVIIDTLLDIGDARVSELDDQLDISRGSIYNHLQTLLKHGYVVKNGDYYELSLKFLSIGGKLKYNGGYESIIEAVAELAKETNEVSLFIVEENGKGVFLHRERTKRAHHTAYIGKRRDLHVLAGGKAILAHIPNERLNNMINRISFDRYTSNSLTSKEEFLKELNQIQDTGLAFNREEEIQGLNAVAVPVFDTNDHVVGALSVAGPKSRMSGEKFTKEVPRILLETTNKLSVDINIRQDNKI